MSSEIQINDNGSSFSAYLAEPTSPNGTAVVCIQEIFGVNLWMRNIADNLASQGFLAIVPDLFWRIEPGVQINGESEEHFAKAFDLYGKFDVNFGLKDIESTIKTARSHEVNVKQKVGTIGFCLGGFLAYMSSINTSADANIGYYGVGIENKLSEKNQIKSPLLLHIATEDQFVPKEIQNKIHQELSEHSCVTIYDYDEDHAFARKGGDAYVEKAAKIANKRSVDFLLEKLK